MARIKVFYRYSYLIKDIEDLSRLIKREKNFKLRMMYREIKKGKEEKLGKNGVKILLATLWGIIYA